MFSNEVRPTKHRNKEQLKTIETDFWRPAGENIKAKHSAKKLAVENGKASKTL